MSGFEVYCILMLDNIKGLFAGFSVVLGILCITAIVCLILAYCNAFEPNYWNKPKEYTDGEWSAKSRKFFSKCLYFIGPIFLISILFCTFLPTTKQVAAIFVIPKLATAENIDAFNEEAKDLYRIFKDILKSEINEVKTLQDNGVN